MKKRVYLSVCKEGRDLGQDPGPQGWHSDLSGEGVGGEVRETRWGVSTVGTGCSMRFALHHRSKKKARGWNQEDKTLLPGCTSSALYWQGLTLSQGAEQKCSQGPASSGFMKPGNERGVHWSLEQQVLKSIKPQVYLIPKPQFFPLKRWPFLAWSLPISKWTPRMLVSWGCCVSHLIWDKGQMVWDIRDIHWDLVAY